MERGDIPFAVALTATERWGFGEADFLRLMRLEPRGCLVAEDGGHRLGVTTLTAYGPVAWIGSVIVKPEARGRGIGGALMHEALAYADELGVESVRLNALLRVVDFYKRLGFRGEFENVRLSGSPARPNPGLPLASPADLPPLADFDAPYFGTKRRKVLDVLFEDFPEGSFILRQGEEILGYVVAGAFEGGLEVAPLVASTSAAAKALLDQALTLGQPSTLTVPTANREAMKLVEGLSFQEVFRSLRMYRGSRRYGGRVRGYYALAGLEKG